MNESDVVVASLRYLEKTLPGFQPAHPLRLVEWAPQPKVLDRTSLGFDSSPAIGCIDANKIVKRLQALDSERAPWVKMFCTCLEPDDLLGWCGINPAVLENLTTAPSIIPVSTASCLIKSVHEIFTIPETPTTPQAEANQQHISTHTATAAGKLNCRAKVVRLADAGSVSSGQRDFGQYEVVFPLVGLDSYLLPPPDTSRQLPISDLFRLMNFNLGPPTSASENHFIKIVLEPLHLQLPLSHKVRHLFPVRSDEPNASTFTFHLKVWPNEFSWTSWVVFHLQQFLIYEIRTRWNREVLRSGGDSWVRGKYGVIPIVGPGSRAPVICVMPIPEGILFRVQKQHLSKITQVARDVLGEYGVRIKKIERTVDTFTAMGLSLRKHGTWTVSSEVLCAWESILPAGALEAEDLKASRAREATTITFRRFGAVAGTVAWYNWLRRKFMPQPGPQMKTTTESALEELKKCRAWDHKMNARRSLLELEKDQKKYLTIPFLPNLKQSRKKKPLHAEADQRMFICCDATVNDRAAMVLQPSGDLVILFPHFPLTTDTIPLDPQSTPETRLVRAVIRGIRAALDWIKTRIQGTPERKAAEALRHKLIVGVSNHEVEAIFGRRYYAGDPALCHDLFSLRSVGFAGVTTRFILPTANPAALLLRRCVDSNGMVSPPATDPYLVRVARNFLGSPMDAMNRAKKLRLERELAGETQRGTRKVIKRRRVESDASDSSSGDSDSRSELDESEDDVHPRGRNEAPRRPERPQTSYKSGVRRGEDDGSSNHAAKSPVFPRPPALLQHDNVAVGTGEYAGTVPDRENWELV